MERSTVSGIVAHIEGQIILVRQQYLSRVLDQFKEGTLTEKEAIDKIFGLFEIE